MKKLFSLIFLLSFSHQADARLSHIFNLLATVRRAMATNAGIHNFFGMPRPEVFVHWIGQPNSTRTFDLSELALAHFEIKPGETVMVYSENQALIVSAEGANGKTEVNRIEPGKTLLFQQPRQKKDSIELFLEFAN